VAARFGRRDNGSVFLESRWVVLWVEFVDLGEILDVNAGLSFLDPSMHTSKLANGAEVQRYALYAEPEITLDIIITFRLRGGRSLILLCRSSVELSAPQPISNIIHITLFVTTSLRRAHAIK
jgi:hypothetical protein